MGKRVSLLLFITVLFYTCQGYGFDKLSYKISCRFVKDQNYLICSERIIFSPGTKLNEIHLHFYPHHKWSNEEIKNYRRYARYFSVDDPFLGEFDPNKAGITKVVVNGKPVSFEWRGKDRTILVLETGQVVAEKVTIDLDFYLKVPRRIGRFGQADGIYSLYRFYPILCVYRDGKFLDYPDVLLHQPYISEAADYKLDITLPKGVIPAATGDLVQRGITDNGIKYTFQTNGLVRDFYLAFSRLYRIYEEEGNGIKIRVFYIGNRKDKARRIARYVKDGLRFYSDKLFPYPYKTITLIPVRLGYGGNESSNVVMLDERVYDLPAILYRYQEFLVVHELGHQWWFNVVGSDEYTQTWMDEGINSYFVQRYLEWKYGENPEVLVLPGWLRLFFPNFTFRQSGIYKWHYLALRGKRISAIGEIGKFKEPSLIFAIAYGKGAWILEILARMYGRDRLLNVLRAYAETYRYKIGWLEDFKKILSRHLGQEAVKILDYYLSDKVVDLSWRRQADFISVDVKGDLPPGGFWVEVSRRGKVERVKFLDGDDVSLPIKDLDWAKIDPDDTVLEVNEDNNVYPLWKGIKASIVPINHLAYDLPVVNDSMVVRSGLYFSEYGLGPRVSFISPSTEFKAWWACQWAPSGGEKAFMASVEKQAPFFSWTSLGLNYIYDDIYERNILHRKLMAFLKFDFGLPGANPFKEIDNLKIYLGREWKERIPRVYYSESNFAYLGMSLFKDWEDFEFLACIEKGGHFMQGEEDFLRASLKMRDRVKIGGTQLEVKGQIGLSDQSRADMFYLGGYDGLRSFSRYDLTGANEILLSADWIVPLWSWPVEKLRRGWVDVDKVSVAAFIDFGRYWNGSFSAGKNKWGIGLGLETDFLIGANLSRIKMRIDFSFDMDDNEQSRVNVYFRL